MSLAGYLFGNVDEQGRLDNDLDEELKQTLQHVDAGVFSQIFNPDTFGIQTSSTNHSPNGSDNEDEDEDSNDITEQHQRQTTQFIPSTQHAASAIDYSDFDETVPDETGTAYSSQQKKLPAIGRYIQSPLSGTPYIPPTMSVKSASKKTAAKRYHVEEDDDYDTYDDDDPTTHKPGIPAPAPTPTPDNIASSSSWPLPQSHTSIPILSDSLSTPSSTSLSPPKLVDITQLFPAFQQNKILNFSDLFMNRTKRRTKFQTPQNQIYMDDGFHYDMAIDQQHMFLHQPFKRRKLDPSPWDKDDDDYYHEVEGQNDQLTQLSITSDNFSHPVDTMEVKDRLYYSVMLEPWEQSIIWDESDTERSQQKESTTLAINSIGRLDGRAIKETNLNHDLDSGDWLHSVIWDDDARTSTSLTNTSSTSQHQRIDPESIKVILDFNDPHMLFDAESLEETQQQLLPTKHVVKKGRKPNPRPIPKMPLIYASDPDSRSKLPQSRFNISNDRHYDMNFAVVRVRQTHGQLVVQHSTPALQLHRTLYKTKLSKSELRSFHRHLFQWPLNSDINFTRVRLMKKKTKNKKQQLSGGGGSSSINGFGSKSSAGDVDGAPRTTKELTLKDTSSYVLMEYSEEHPPIISNIGMGTLIVNYYRKTDPKDDYVPHMDLGEPFVLEVEDTSPFMTFGNVEPGQTIQVMYNNMVRAPLFQHQVNKTDFLLVRSTYHGESKYYLRAIPAMFVMGQTYPVQEVPGPQSRRVTTTVKNRLQIVAYRLITKHPQQRLKMSKLASRFPEYQDIQVRQRLKEFLEYKRHSKDNGGGYWKVRQSKEGRGGPERKPPGEDQLRQMCTPEMVCLYESMLVGERHLLDLGYGNIDDTADQDDNSALQLETEQQLAPWFATRNFINACQGKAMLKLSGDGDPTGCGEGFSFIRVSMKDIFLRAGESAEKKLAQIKSRPKSAHRYNVAEQQQVYKEEIERIWNTQWNSLSRTEEPEYSMQEIMDDSSADERDMDQMTSPMTPDNVDWRHQRRYDRATSESIYDDMTDDNLSVAESYSSQAQTRDRELRITRQIRGDDGQIKAVIEIVRDPAVIKAYLAQRHLIMENAANLETIDPTNSHEKNARMKKQTQQQLAKLKRMAERRRQRQLSKTAALAENPVLGLMRGKREGAMRRCGNCGQLGHMKTNKSCPNFPDKNKNNTNTSKSSNTDVALDDGSQTPLSGFTSPPAPQSIPLVFTSP
ncbi:hypothetical protein BCR42DRAFT_381001 [Absidia repens]|uniref:Transcription initiation factor TFIID subunit 1 histone acetyltransferase domain-containing protein n=1 Tax=Absidia repens TaxID=90262 RepID=A0A1X2I5V9_9FUNG|nr:hypothetical protein BCR42DRAFT_381001 [Absidia repens]